jgi:hypothetical protein
MDKKTLDELIGRINSGKATDEELAAYNHYLNQATDGGEGWNEQRFGQEDTFGAQMLDEINRRIGYRPKRVVRLWPRIAAVASVLLIVSVGSYFLLHQKPAQQLAEVQDVAPGTNHALLRIGHGRTVVLDNTKNGLIAQNGNTKIHKTANGQLAYSTTSQAPAPTAMVYDTLVNPAGAKVYHLKLSDGSSLTVNAATTLRFPEHFSGKERKIELLNGELYGEVTHNEAMPFRVSAGNALIEDIGTHFNINAYNDEPDTRITLLEGSVKVSVKGSATLLKPGQQAVINARDQVRLVKDADTEDAIAWKDGVFRFDSEDLAGIMRKIARWYDVTVVYTDNSVKELPFGAVTTRFANVSQVLKMLEKTNEVHFKIEGKKIIVSK